MIHRVFSIPLDKNKFDIEISTIKQIARNNGFSDTIINNLISKKKTKIALNLVYPNSKSTSHTRYISLTYFGKVSEQIGDILRKYNFYISYKPFKKLSSCIFNNKDATPLIYKSGVYKLHCNTCEGVYIGQTGRNFAIRFQEHTRSFNLKKTDSTYANHLLEMNHLPGGHITPLHLVNKGIKLNLFEAL